MWKAVVTVCILGLLAGIVVVAGIFGLPHLLPKPEEKSTQPLPKVWVWEVPPVSGNLDYTTSGIVEPPRRKVLVSDLGGIVSEVLVRDGQVLKEGDPVIQLDDSRDRMLYQNLQVKLALAQSQLQLAMINASPNTPMAQGSATAKALSSSKKTVLQVHDKPFYRSSPNAENTAPHLSSSPGVVTAQQELDAVTQEMQSVLERIEAHTLVMPAGGKIKSVLVSTHQMVAPNTPVAEIMATKSPLVATSLPLRLLQGLTIGQPVLIRIPEGGSPLKAAGTVDSLQTFAVEDTPLPRSGWVKVVVTQAMPTRLNKGQTVDVVFHLKTDKLVRVPKKALHYKDKKPYVWIIKEHNKAQWAMRRWVIKGYNLGNLVEIEDGLEEGERIVLKASQKLSHKSRVTVEGHKTVDL